LFFTAIFQHCINKVKHNMDINSESVRPTAINHLVGMPHIKEQVRVALDASFADNTKFPNTLLVSEPGLGKSEICAVLKHELAVELHTIVGVSVTHLADLNALLLSANDKDLIYITECDSLRSEFQNALYLAIDRGEIVLSGSKGRAPQRIKIPDITLLLDTNYESALLPALTSRMRQTLYIPFSSVDDLAEIIRRRARALGWSLEEEVPAFLGKLSKGVPRQAIRLLASSYRVTRSEGKTTIQISDARRAVMLEGLDDRMGLTSQEQAYLHAVASGISRIGTIASKIAMPVTTVQKVVEPFLIRSGLLSKDEGRRELTAEGRDFVAHFSAT